MGAKSLFGSVCVGLSLCATTAAAQESAQRPQEVAPRFDLTVEARQLSFDELSKLVPALEQVQLPPGFKITKLEARGPLDRIAISFAAESPRSTIRAEAVVDASEPGRSAKGTATLRRVDLAALLDRPTLPSDVSADVEYDLAFGGEEGTRGTFAVAAPALAMAGYEATRIDVKGRIDGDDLRFDGSVGAYGAAVTADGRVTLGEEVTYDVKGRIRNVNLARLPKALDLPALDSDFDLAYQVGGSGAAPRGRVTLDRSSVEGATIVEGTSATFERHGEDFVYHAEGRVQGLDLQRLGKGLEIEALAGERFASDVSARFSLDGRGSQLEPVRLTIEDSALFGGRVPAMDARVALTDQGLTFDVEGEFRDWDVGTLAGQPDAQGSLSGSLDADGTIPRQGDDLVPGRITASVHVSFEPSSVEGIGIDQGVVNARIENGELVQVDRIDITGEELAVRASGAVGLDGSRPTSLQYFVKTPPLEALTDLIGADVSGELTLEGRVTGTEHLEVAGSLTGSGVGYGANRAAELSSDYTVSVAPADLAGATVEATVRASGLELGGRSFDTLEATTAYAERTLDFDMAMAGAEQSMEAAGRANLGEGATEVTLTELALATGESRWQLASGAQPRISYGDSVLEVADLKLTSEADQRLTVDGTLGGAGDALRVNAENVDVAPFAALAGRDAMTGRLSADATIAGEFDALTAEGTFDLADADVQGVALSALTGTVDLNAERLAFDVRVERPDASWLRARGELPATLVRGGGAEAAAGPIDITVDSSPIGLDLVQTFTDQLTDVQGTLQVEARITGTTDDPQPDGEILIRGGAFTVPRFGTHYDRLDATIALEADAIAIEQFAVVDDDGDELRVSGRLPMSELEVSGVELAITSNGIEVVDNELGDVEMATDLTVSGALTEPLVTGRVELTESTLNVDEILELGGGEDVYAVRAAEQGLIDGEVSATEDEGLLAGVPVALDLTVEVPALLLRGRDMKTAGGAGVGLGNVNLTAEGDLALRKNSDGPLRITGEVEMVRGTYEFQGREFELVRGSTIRFAGLTELNPLLDVTARRQISGVEALVQVGGTLEEPALNLSSNPPLDEADILSLIIFNRPANSLGAGEQVSLADQAGAIASGFAAGQLTEAMGDAIDVDLLEIEASATDGGITPSVTIGEQFGDLFVKVQQAFGETSQSRVVVEYSLTDWLRLESSFVDDRSTVQPLLRRQEDSGVDAVIEFEY